VRAGWRAAGPSLLEEGSAQHLVTPRVYRDVRILRPAVLVASALALACVVAAVTSSGGARSVMTATGTSSEVPLAMMPDPAEAVQVAQETVTQVDPFHNDGSWIGARPPPVLPASPPSGALLGCPGAETARALHEDSTLHTPSLYTQITVPPWPASLSLLSAATQRC